MIHVIYDRPQHSLRVDGHACSGEPGRDLICAAASILAYTFASAAANLEQAGGAKDVTVELTPGRAVIALLPTGKAEKGLRLMLDAVCAGYELLARNYPEHVQYERREISGA